MADFSGVIDDLKGELGGIIKDIVKTEMEANKADKAVDGLKKNMKDVEKLASNTFKAISSIQMGIADKLKTATAESAKMLNKQLDAINEVQRQMQRQGNTQKYALASKSEAAEGAVSNYKKGESFYG